MKKPILAAAIMGLFLLPAKSQETFPPSLLTHRPRLTAKIRASRPDPVSLTVPAETEVAVLVLSGVHTRVSHVDDLVTARLLQPVYVNGRLALPSGSLLDGRITLLRPSGRLHRPAELGLRFNKITLPDGQAEPTAAILAAMDNSKALGLHLDAEGHLTGGRAFSWKSLLGGFVGLGALGTVRAAMVGPAAASAILPLGGAALAGFEILWPRGRDVNLPPDTPCRLRLNYPLTVRVAW